jgi:hypothetical protein
MNFISLSNKSVNIKEFINFWSQFYIDPGERKYVDNINKNPCDKDALLALFEWKNGSKLSKGKKKSFEAKISISSKLDIINSLKSHFELKKFLEEFKEVSTIWKIFLLHIIKPARYPIFDQHVYRAFYYIKNFKVRELSYDNKEKEKEYFEDYLPFFKQIQGGHPIKKLDESLWSFGKFLKGNYRKMIVK